MKVLVLGANGMLGHAVFRETATDPRHDVWGTTRGVDGRLRLPETAQQRLIAGVDVRDEDAVADALNRVRPDVVVNGVGLVKQLEAASDPALALPINAEFPHRLAGLCGGLGIRMIQLSTDCVFSGRQGRYRESDASDAEDLYGQSKHLGEVSQLRHVITLRTSGIGHELASNRGLLSWFLSQEGAVKGYAKAIYSGLPAVELARVIKDYVVPNPSLWGLYHVSSSPISKLELLQLIARVYRKDIQIIPDEGLAIDRSLDSSRFTEAVGYVAAAWPELIAFMRQRHLAAA